MALVPSSYIKNKKIDCVGETLSVIGMTFALGRVRVKPPAMGIFSLLELIGSHFCDAPGAGGFPDLCRSFAVLVRGREAVEEARRYIEEDARDLEKSGARLIAATDGAIFRRMEEFYRFIVELPRGGFEMIPGSSRPSEPFLFGAPALGGAAMLGGTLGLSYAAVFWEVPLALLGHMAAANATAHGVDGVARPKDPEDIERQLRLAREREARGEAHPWQIAEPEIYGCPAKQDKN